MTVAFMFIFVLDQYIRSVKTIEINFDRTIDFSKISRISY